jgi:hypothetical protein
LMQKLSSEQLIDKKEALFEDGVDQFKTNLSALVKTLSDHQIPIYIGTLSSNLLQPPLDHSATQRTTFLSLELYNQGMKKLEKNDIQKGIQLLHRAKEEDQLRFRAPKAFNDPCFRVTAYLSTRKIIFLSMFIQISKAII